MSKAAYWQRGETLDYKNNTAEVIEANSIIQIQGRIGVAGTSINPGEVGSLHVTGVYEMPKTGATAIAQGADVYFDGTGITATSGGTKAGYAAADAAEADTVILVKLQG